MIVGNGLIASAFRHAGIHSPHHVIFASGVSNSTETRSEAYQRELTLLDHHLGKSTTIVYFSTTSIFDPTKQDSIYIRHKKHIEDIIQSQANSFLIVRLPIMLGNSPNPFTLINFLVNAISKSRPLELHAKACRHLLDIDDLVPVLFKFIQETQTRNRINILGSEKITIPELVKKIESILHKRGNYTWLDTGACYDIPEDEGECIFIQDPDYTEKILKKYIGLQYI
jgi:nucleoside-diphosphate-sugar epimerase